MFVQTVGVIWDVVGTEIFTSVLVLVFWHHCSFVASLSSVYIFYFFSHRSWVKCLMFYVAFSVEMLVNFVTNWLYQSELNLFSFYPTLLSLCLCLSAPCFFVTSLCLGIALLKFSVKFSIYVSLTIFLSRYTDRQIARLLFSVVHLLLFHKIKFISSIAELLWRLCILSHLKPYFCGFSLAFLLSIVK